MLPRVLASLGELILAVVLSGIILLVFASVMLVILWAFNRGLQLFVGLFGYEIGDFFGWVLGKLHIKRKEEK